MSESQQQLIPATKHSGVMGGSNAARRINCNGSYELERELPDPPDSDYAIQGNVFHAAMELILTADPQNDSELANLFNDLVGQNLGFGDAWEITEDQIDAKVAPAWAAWVEIRDEYNIDDWFIEQRVSLDSVIPKAFGTVDILGKDSARNIHILDWKFGDGIPVAVKANMQLSFYAAGALYDEDPEVKEFCDDINRVIFHIVQPREGFDQVRQTWETDTAYIETFVDLAVNAADASLKPNATLKAGEHCHFCKAKVPTCPLHKEAAIVALGTQLTTMTAPELNQALDMALLLKSWITDVFALAQRELEVGATIPGYKLVAKRGKRQWIATEIKVREELKKHKVKVKDMNVAPKLKSPTQIEKLSKDVYKDIEYMVASKSSGVTVVPDDDNRPAVVDSFALLANAMPDGKQET
jgi:hypothetical protein